MYVFVTLTFQDPVQVDEHRIQHRLLALGVITLILGHHLNAVHSTTTTKVTLFKDSGAPFCSNQLGLPASTAVWRPWGLHSGFFFTYSIIWGWINAEQILQHIATFRMSKGHVIIHLKPENSQIAVWRMRVSVLEMRGQCNPGEDKEFYWFWVILSYL